MQSSTNNLITYGPLGLSALVIIGLLIGWLLGRLDFGTTIGIIGTILAANGIVGVGVSTVKSIAATLAPPTSRISRVSGAYDPGRAPGVPPRASATSEEDK